MDAHPCFDDEIARDLAPAERRHGERRAAAPIDGTHAALLQALLRELAGRLHGHEHLRWINASQGREVRLIRVESVQYFQADAKYTRVVTADGEALIRTSLRELQRQLDPELFWPIHRSTIVNVNAIAGVLRDGRGRARVRLKSRDERLCVSEAHEHLFRQM